MTGYRTGAGADGDGGGAADGPAAPGPAAANEITLPEWGDLPADRLMGRGHPAGDFVEAHEWVVVEEDVGRLRLDVHLPPQVRNPRGQLFGGFTGTYVDLVSLYATRAGPDRLSPTVPRTWLATLSMRIDYLGPITGPRFAIDAVVEHQRGRTAFVVTRMFQGDELAVHAVATLRRIDPGPG